MNLRKLCLLTLCLGCFSMLFVSCGKSDEEEVLDCYGDHINESTFASYSEAISAWGGDPTNPELCAAAKAAYIDYLTELEGYARCVRDNGVALRAGFENIDELIANLENAEDDFEC